MHTTSALQGKYISIKLTSQSKPLFASFNPWFSFMPVQKMKIKRKYNSRIFFFTNILKLMDETTFTHGLYSYRERLQYYTNEQIKDSLMINNVSLCYQDKAAIGRSLYLILNFRSILRNKRILCV